MRRSHLTAIPLVLAGLAAASFAFAQTSAGGMSTQIPPGARAEGLGRAYAGLADDASAAWWNPAGLAFLSGNQLSLMHTQLVPDLADDVYFEYLSFTHQYLGWGSVGVSTAYLTYGKSEATNPDGVTVGEFKSYEVVPQITYGTRLTPNIGIGVGLKYISVNLVPAWVLVAVGAAPEGSTKSGSGKSFAADLGGLVHIPLGDRTIVRDVQVGLVVKNLGPNIAFLNEEQSDPLARQAILGLGSTVYARDPLAVRFAFEANQSLISPVRLKDMILGGGFELTYNNLISARAGYYSDPVGTIQDLTYGVGIAPIRRVRFDYASIPQSKFLGKDSRVSKFSLTAGF